MNIDIKDTITLSDDNSYVVASKTNYQNNTYYYLIDKANNENIKFYFENTKNSSLVETEDKILIQQLLPHFLKASSKALTKEDLELIENNNIIE